MAKYWIENPHNFVYIDHVNRNTLDNRRENLRWCSIEQNMQNRAPSKDRTSKYKGVSWSKEKERWHVAININGKTKVVGKFKEEKYAAQKYNEYAKKFYGEFAYLNEV